MSGFISEPPRSDEEQFAAATFGNESYAQSHEHERSATMSRAPTAVAARGNDAPLQEISAAQKMLSATSGSLFTSLLVTPLDVVRVRLQSQPSSSNLSPLRTSSFNIAGLASNPNIGVTACCREVFWVNNNAQNCLATTSAIPSPAAAPLRGGRPSHASTMSVEHCVVEETRQKTFNTTFDGLRKIARNEGVLTLWRGLSPTLAMAVPGNVIYFAGYDYLRTNKHSLVHNYIADQYAPLIAGSIARVAAAVVVSPIEMFRTRMQATSGGSTGIFALTLRGLGDLVQSQGYTALWRGLTLTMWRDVPFSGFYWWGYEAVRNSLTDAREKSRGRTLERGSGRHEMRSRSRSQENHSATFVDSFIAGATSGAIASVVTTPFDVGKTRQQVFAHAKDDMGSSASATATKAAQSASKDLLPEERSMPRFLYHIFQTEGTAGLFRGWAARCMKVAPACAIMISSYEVGKKMAQRVNDKREGGKAAW